MFWRQKPMNLYKSDMRVEFIDKKEKEVIEDLIGRALAEDIRSGDITTNSIIGERTKAKAVWKTKAKGVIAGLAIAGMVFKKLDSDLQWQALIEDGDFVNKNVEIAAFSGKARAILTAERTALNIAQRMSGIATKTRQFVDEIAPFDVQILDTRKTVPGLRLLDKYAVNIGGGRNHRMGLFDLALIKDNHIAAAGSIANAVQKVRENAPEITIEVETTDMQQIDEALAAEADIIMLDNMSLELMNEAVKEIGDRAETEASGNVELSNVYEIAATGVDYISVGALTHSVKAFDISQSLV
jgi:nicotinate-nucleotide pyrophosphorylase (carboxylating)